MVDSKGAGNAAILVESLQLACEAWLAFDWNAQLIAVQQSLSFTKEAKDASVTARKQLTDTTKAFRKSVKTVEQAGANLQQDPTPDHVTATVKAIDGLAKEAKGTIKSYQEEIDRITKRCKAVENSHGVLGLALQEVPDPTVIMGTCIEQIQAQQAQMNQMLQTVEKLNKETNSQQETIEKLKKENERLQHKSSQHGGSSMTREERDELVQLRREVAEYEAEFRTLKNQDITIRKLEAKIAELQTVGEEQLHLQLEKAKEELAETEGRRAADALEREAAMERKVQTLELQLRAERAGREATQAHLLEADEGVSQREAAWEAQRRILVDDAERVREELQIASRERDELKLKIAAFSGKKGTSMTPPTSTGVSMKDLMLERSAYEAEVAELTETASVLREELRLKEETLMDEKRISQARLDSFERDRASLLATIASLEKELSVAPSPGLVESMKRELRILKRLEYNADDVDAERDPEIAGGKDEEKDLESVLVAKLRRAESELVNERINKAELLSEIKALRESLNESKKEKDEADKLVASLERDLERAIAAPSSTKKAANVAVVEEDPTALQQILDPNDPESQSQPKPRTLPQSTSSRDSERAEDDHTVATIVMAQRDRLRARCDALEAERDSFKRELQLQVQVSESLKADNTKLYEKVRYLQSYNRAPVSRGSYNRSASAGDRDLDLEALEQRYEASVDPFRQFSRAERQRKLNEMSPMERAVFIVAKTVLATKEMRTALFFYVLALHLLVFVTTYHWSHTDMCQAVDGEHLAHLPPPLPAHLQGQMAMNAASNAGA